MVWVLYLHTSLVKSVFLCLLWKTEALHSQLLSKLCPFLSLVFLSFFSTSSLARGMKCTSRLKPIDCHFNIWEWSKSYVQHGSWLKVILLNKLLVLLPGDIRDPRQGKMIKLFFKSWWIPLSHNFLNVKIIICAYLYTRSDPLYSHAIEGFRLQDYSSLDKILCLRKGVLRDLWFTCKSWKIANLKSETSKWPEQRIITMLIFLFRSTENIKIM